MLTIGETGADFTPESTRTSKSPSRNCADASFLWFYPRMRYPVLYGSKVAGFRDHLRRLKANIQILGTLHDVET